MIGGCGDTLAVVHVIPSTLNPHVDLVLENMSHGILSKRTKYFNVVLLTFGHLKNK
jgi:hypothetical protein